MMVWKIIITRAFSNKFKKYKKNNDFAIALEKKIKRLKENPESVGGNLVGRLKSHKSTRIIGKFRLMFRINYENKTVSLEAIDHRKFDYKNF